jgi:hypothetical protein
LGSTRLANVKRLDDSPKENNTGLKALPTCRCARVARLNMPGMASRPPTRASTSLARGSMATSAAWGPSSSRIVPGVSGVMR